MMKNNEDIQYLMFDDDADDEYCRDEEWRAKAKTSLVERREVEPLFFSHKFYLSILSM